MTDMDATHPATHAVTNLVTLAVDDNKVTPGLLGFVVFAVLAAAVWMLMKSMNRHMGKVDFKEEEKRGGEGTAAHEPATAAPGPRQKKQ